MNIAGKSGRPRRIAAIGAVVVAILVVTLAPTGRDTLSPFSFAFDLERRTASDAVLNFLLFLPLGFVIAWNGRSALAAGVVGFLLASVIEIAQTFLPGRDPALSDIVFNTLGAVGGGLIAMRRRVLSSPDPKAAAVLTAVSLSLAAAIMIATTYLLEPFPFEQPVLIESAGDDVVLRYTSRGGAFGLDQPEYWATGGLDGKQGGRQPIAAVSRDRSRWEITIGTYRAILGPTVGQGWAMLAYPDAISRRWGGFVSSLWMFAMFFPVGFWSRERLLPAAVFSVLLLALLPEIMGVVATRPHEWAGASMGLLAAALPGFRRRATRV